MSAKRGFSLLEMVVATAVMAIAVVALLSGLGGSARNAARLREHDRAVQLAQLRMNELLVDSSVPGNVELADQFDRRLTGGVEAGWRARVTPFALSPAPAPGQLMMDRVELEVWWMSGPSRRSLTLEGYRERTMRPEDVPVTPQ